MNNDITLNSLHLWSKIYNTELQFGFMYIRFHDTFWSFLSLYFTMGHVALVVIAGTTKPTSTLSLNQVTAINLETQSSNELQWHDSDDEGILPKEPYLPCVSMAGRAILAGCPRWEGIRVIAPAMVTRQHAPISTTRSVHQVEQLTNFVMF